MTTRSRPALCLAALLLTTAACSARPEGAPTPPAATPPSAGSAPSAGSPLTGVLLLGDSVAAGQALPLTAAFAAAGVRFRSLASDGGGNVVGPFAEKNWAGLPERIAAERPTAVVYQITTYDWGGEQEQRAAYRRLLDAVTAAGARLVVVTAPPIRADEFYAPHLAELGRAAAAARAVAQASAGRAHVLDAGQVWGGSYQRTRNGTVDRSTDGVHACPQGAARFTAWLLGELAGLFPGFVPPAPGAWANTGWASDRRFVGC